MQQKIYLVVGLLLIVGSIFLLSYSGFRYTTEEKVAEIGPVTITNEEHKVIPFYHPIGGGIMLLVGIGLVVFSRRM